MVCSIYKSFRKLKRRGFVKRDRPVFRRDVIFLDDHLFTIDLERWEVTVATPKGRVRFPLLHGSYHERFRDWKVGQAWLVKRGEELWLKLVFSKVVKLKEPNGKALAVDVNENNVTIASPRGFRQITTRERPIRTAYFLKRRKIQRLGGKVRLKLLMKYCSRERNRVTDIYHKVANRIVERALEEGVTVVVMEKLRGIRKKIRYTREMNGRLHRWSFRRFQLILEYKAKLFGLNVVYVDARGTSRLCPICGGKLRKSPNGYRLMRCPSCGLIDDRDVIAFLNLLKRYVGSSVPPES